MVASVANALSRWRAGVTRIWGRGPCAEPHLFRRLVTTGNMRGNALLSGLRALKISFGIERYDPSEGNKNS